MRFALLLVLAAGIVPAQTFSVIHKKSLWRDGRGKLSISDTGIDYRAEKAKESRNWSYLDVQHFDRISRKEFTILTYEDERRFFGRDKEYHFVITDGGLDDRLFRLISKRLGRPVTDRVVPEVLEAGYEVPVKHRHTFGGCEGRIRFTENAIYYVTDHKEDARQWKLDRDVQSVWSMDPFQLEIHAYDNNRREFSRTRTYKFDLKEPLNPEFYRELKWKLYRLEVAHQPIR